MEDAWQETDPARVGYSLANLSELMRSCLDAASARSVVEIGAFRGGLTRELLGWAAGTGARVTAVDPAPEPQLLTLAEQHPELELIRETSHDALRRLPLPDALIIDSDHNYYTLSEELRLVEEKASGRDLPLMLFHDVAWPHARRDTYYVLERVPEEYRHPLAHNACLVPGEPGTSKHGLPFEWVAAREGGPRNGVLTAIEDFIGERDDLRLAKIPAFFGLGVLWHRDAPWAEAVAAIVAPWDSNPVLARLEENRVRHLIMWRTLSLTLDEEREHHSELERLLRKLYESRAFAIAERISWLRRRGRPRISRAEIRRALGQ